MKYKRVFYSIIVIILTIFSVSTILDYRVDSSKLDGSTPSSDTLSIESPFFITEEILNEKINQKVEEEDASIEKSNVERDDNTQVKKEVQEKKEVIDETPSKSSKEEFSNVDVLGRPVDKTVFSQSIIRKKDDMFSHFEYYREYDKETQHFLIAQLKEGIKRAKLDQFEDRLSQDRTIEDINVNKIENKLSSKDKNNLDKIIDKLGPINGLKLMKILNSGITPEEQQDMHDLLQDKLSEEEIILLNDILGRYMDK